MTKRIVLCLSHSIEEYDQLRLLTDLGYEVASIGGYINPATPHDNKRPALPDVPYFPEVQAAVDALGTADNLGAAQSRMPKAILDWLGDDGILIYHHYLDRLFGQWDYIKDWMRGSSQRRVIWRTVGQSVENNERMAQPFRADGMEIVRYSPKEANIPGYAGSDALIRFYKDWNDYPIWQGGGEYVLGFGQHYAQRDPWTNYGFFKAATQGLPVRVFGPGSEEIGGLGELSFDALKDELTRAKVLLYTGTQPASYTLGLLEAMAVGVPIVSIGPAWFSIFQPYGPSLFEGHELVQEWTDSPTQAHDILRAFLTRNSEYDRKQSDFLRGQRTTFSDYFDRPPVAKQWREFLG